MRLAALALLAPLLAPGLAFGQARNVGPGVADRSASIQRGGSDDVVFGGEFQTSVEYDRNAARGGRSGYGDLFTESLAAAYLLLPHGFTVFGVARLEPAPRDPDGTDRWFRDHAAWVDEFYVTWSRGTIDLFAGKIHPRFGTAWDQGPGLFGTDLGRQYELTEKLGGGLRLWLSDVLGITRAAGTHVFQAEAFTADRTFLSSSLLARRWQSTQTIVDPLTGEVTERSRLTWQNRRGTGGADNAAFASGAVVSLTGYGVPMPRGLAGYSLAWSQRRPGEDATLAGRAGTENGFAAAAFWNIPLPLRLTAVPYVEYVRQETANGFRGARAEFLTVGGSLRYTPLTLDYAFQQRVDTDRREGTRGTFVQHAASLTYDLYFLMPTPVLRPLAATVGVRRTREDGVTTNDVGAALTWLWRF